MFQKCATRDATRSVLLRNLAEARREIFAYIEVWYNRRRLHSSLGYACPEEYEKLLEAV